jgi:hypothetical protein
MLPNGSTSRAILPAIACALLAVAACSDATAPDKQPTTVAVGVASLDGPHYSETPEHNPVVTCGVDLRAVATGRGNATWRGATLRFYIGPNHQTLLDTAVFNGDEIGPSWSEDGTIAAGDTQLTHWDLGAGIPFSATFEYRYESTKGVQKTTTTMECGNLVAADAPAPVVSSISATPPSGELPAGAPLTVSYVVDAPGGAWRTQVVLSGPCDVVMTFNEKLETRLTRTVAVPIPGSCALGAPVTVTVYALDALAQLGTGSAQIPVILTDRQAPSIFAWFGDGAAGNFHGDYYGGDSIRVALQANDNHGVSALIWEVLPFGGRDSLLVSGLGAGDYVWVHLRPEWNGAFQLRFSARDAIGLMSPAVVTGLDSARVHPVANYPTRTVTIPDEVDAMVHDARRNMLYLAQANRSAITMLSLATMQVVGTIPLDAPPTDLDITPGGDSLIVVVSGKLALDVVDLRGAAPQLSAFALPWLDSATVQRPYNVRVGSNGRAYLTVRGTASSANRLVELDLASGSVRTLTQAGDNGDTGAGLLERSFDRSVLVLNAGSATCFQRYDIASDSFGRCAAGRGFYPRPVADETGARIAVGLDVYDASMNLLPKTHGDLVQGYPPGTILSPDGSTLFAAIPEQGYIRLRASDSEVIERFGVKLYSSLRAISRDGTMLFDFVPNITRSQTTVSVVQLR